jgi:2-C-methyl-D-erythritol 4-phosphate cytidylyltransferase
MDCIYLSAGLGVRLKEAKPKQFITLLGKPIFIYALEVLERVDEVEKILLMFHPDYRRMYEKYLKNYNLSKIELVEGGKTRQESVWNGLQKVNSKRVLIHEAARPFISKEFLLDLLEYRESAVVPTIPIPFSVAGGETYMEQELERSKLHNIQLPQVFDTHVLSRAHLKAQQENFIAFEDGILVFRFGEKVRFVEGLENNIKITTPLDLVIAESLLKGVYQ